MTDSQNAEIIWDYMRLHQPIPKSDAIFVLGSLTVKVADVGARLFHQGKADWIIFSGGLGSITKSLMEKSEAETFADRAAELGVPRDRMILETKSTNTGENIRFTHQLLQQQGRDFTSIILVQKPYMERRTYATFVKQWPDPETTFTVTSQNVGFEEYLQDGDDRDWVINNLVGDLQRMREYSKQGFQVEQEVPDEVWRAYEALVAAGYDKRLVQA